MIEKFCGYLQRKERILKGIGQNMKAIQYQYQGNIVIWIVGGKPFQAASNQLLKSMKAILFHQIMVGEGEKGGDDEHVVGIKWLFYYFTEIMEGIFKKLMTFYAFDRFLIFLYFG